MKKILISTILIIIIIFIFNGHINHGNYIRKKKDSSILKKNDSSMITVNNSNIEVIPIHRVGEAINDYLPLDVLDGLGAKKINDDKIRIFVNHEIVNNARISYFDFKINDLKKFRDIKSIESNIAFDKIISKSRNPIN